MSGSKCSFPSRVKKDTTPCTTGWLFPTAGIRVVVLIWCFVEAGCVHFDHRGAARLEAGQQHAQNTTASGSTLLKAPWTQELPETLAKHLETPADIGALIEHDVRLLVNTLFQGFDPPLQSKVVWAVTLYFAALWFGFFFRYLYVSDTLRASERWEEELGAQVNMLTPGREQRIEPDVVICFHHPARKRKDDSHQVNPDILGCVLPERYQMGALSKALESMMIPQRSDRPPTVRNARGEFSMAGDASSPARGFRPWSASQSIEDVQGEESDESKGVEVYELGEVRKQLILDLLDLLPHKGLHVQLWTSIDKEELFLGISMRSVRSTQYYLYKYQCDVMVVPGFIAGQLNMELPLDEEASAPPSVVYDPQHVRLLQEAEVVQRVDQLYQVYNDQGGEATLANNRVRVTAIQHELARLIDLRVALKHGLVTGYYPVHNPAWIQLLREKWSSTKDVFMLSEPLPLLREYYGERLAFEFAWTGTYTKAIVALAMFSVGNFVIRRFCWMNGMTYINDRQIISSSIVILMWSKVAQQLWDQEKNFYLELWEVERGKHEKTSRRRFPRPEFIGERRKSDADPRVMELKYPRNWWLQLTTRKLISFFVTAWLCELVATYVIALVERTQGKLSLMDTLLLSGFIKVCEICYNPLAEFLTEWENHKYDEDYYDSLVFKMYFFQFVNYYWWFVCLCLYQKLKGFCDTEGQESCLETLQQQLRRVCLFNLAYSVGEQVMCTGFVKFQLWWIAWRQSKAASSDFNSEREVKERRSGAEEQSKYVRVGNREHIDSMMLRVMALGYIVFFGAIEPLTVPAVWLTFVLHLRMQAWMMTTSKQRPWPTVSGGVGAWSSAMRIMLEVNTIFSVCIVVTYGELFSGSSNIAKVSFVIMWIVGAQLMSSVIGAIIPSNRKATQTLQTRKSATRQRLFELIMNQVAPERSPDLTESEVAGTRTLVERENVRRAEAGEWESIPFRP